MKNSKILVYDGSFNGFLTAIFVGFEEQLNVADIRKNGRTQNGLFSEIQTVFTQMDKAKRVWKGIQNKSNNAIKQLYFAYLSESEGIEFLLYKYIQGLFSSEAELLEAPSESYKIEHLAAMVAKEKNRIEASLNFEYTGDGIYFANLAPDHNILPLISKYFRSRYADNPWIIYDIKRKYGIYYNGKGVEMVTLDLKEMHSLNAINPNLSRGETMDYDKIRNDYFKRADITSLINRKLFKQPPAKRYRSYLQEKHAV
ncbi:TIGR03915 family putative DNA repair protein [Muriicola sp. Z0-33]|uniref:TIGR03915 family putative DNA repair protein n=1 Tax=Muriicola sp. Z0-33 TaxID=2816957 RepID=UPI0022371FF8|nr:TIGR03915 family putative DNA repair protein [Muriicola sp. Z0-33]MCW5515356.1 TIGR03915 family putative DNA repair protein [Muriicola sp. Z0-33]